MKSTLLFNIALVIDGITLLLLIANIAPMFSLHDEHFNRMAQMLAIALPTLLLLLVGLAFWLKSNGKMTAANILVWIPALPVMAGIVIWGGLAAIFILFGK